MFCLTFTLIALFVALLYLYFTWTFNFWKKRGVEGPKPLPFVGSFPGLYSSKRHLIDDYEKIYRSYKDKERFAGVFNLRDPQLLITDPKLAHDILVTHFKNFHDNTISKMLNREKDVLFSEHPFVVNGEEWKTTRQMISPGFSGNRLKAYHPIIHQTCRKLTKYLNGVCKDPPKDGVKVKEIAMMFTLDIIAAGLYGVDSGTFTDQHPSEMFRISEGLFNQSGLFFLYQTVLTMFPWVKNLVNVSFFDDKVGKYFLKVLDQSIKQRKESGIEGNDFLSFLLELNKKNPMTREKMIAHTMSFFIDGFETTACAIANVFVAIARDPDCQEKLIKEAEGNLDENGSISMEAINELQYLDAVFHEALRILPPVIFYSKICTEEIEIQRKDGSKFLVEKGVEVVLPNYSFQKDEQYFVDPDVFNPDRFDGDGTLKDLKRDGLLMPFGDGPRQCMGMKLSSLEIKACIIEIVRNFKVTPNKKTRNDNKIDPNFFIGALNGGVWLDFEPRKKNL